MPRKVFSTVLVLMILCVAQLAQAQQVHWRSETVGGKKWHVWNVRLEVQQFSQPDGNTCGPTTALARANYTRGIGWYMTRVVEDGNGTTVYETIETWPQIVQIMQLIAPSDATSVEELMSMDYFLFNWQLHGMRLPSGAFDYDSFFYFYAKGWTSKQRALGQTTGLLQGNVDPIQFAGKTWRNRPPQVEASLAGSHWMMITGFQFRAPEAPATPTSTRTEYDWTRASIDGVYLFDPTYGSAFYAARGLARWSVSPDRLVTPTELFDKYWIAALATRYLWAILLYSDRGNINRGQWKADSSEPWNSLLVTWPYGLGEAFCSEDGLICWDNSNE